MTKEELAAQLDGREIRCEITRDEAKAAKLDGLVVVYGGSDDLLELAGALEDEVGLYGGGTVSVDRRGALGWEQHGGTTAEFEERRRVARKIEARWCDDGEPAWTYQTDIPHATFQILEDGEVYCRGFVFSLNDL